MARRGRRQYKRRNTAGKKRVGVISAVVFAVILIAFLVVYFVMKNAVDKVAADIIRDNIYIEKVDVSGMKRHWMNSLQNIRNRRSNWLLKSLK